VLRKFHYIQSAKKKIEIHDATVQDIAELARVHVGDQQHLEAACERRPSSQVLPWESAPRGIR
jgi:hypothetical protein